MKPGYLLFNILMMCLLSACYQPVAQNKSETSGYVDNYKPGIDDIQVASLLALNSLYPASGPLEGGTEIDLIGSNFCEKPAVTIGGKLANGLIFRNKSRLSITTPPGEYGAVDVKVKCEKEETVLTKGFSYYYQVLVNEISENIILSTGGQKIIINGQGFVGGTLVKIGGQPADIVAFPSENEITVKTPVLAAGQYKLVVSNINGSAAAADSILVVEPLNIEKLEPMAGPLAGNTEVTVYGSALFEGSSLILGGQGTPLLAAAGNGESLRFNTPAAASEGVVSLRVTNKFGSASKERAFVYLDDANTEARLIAALPAVGPAAGNSQVSLIGYRLPAAAKVYFGSVQAGCAQVTENEYSCQVPAGADGLVDIKLTADDLTLNLPDGYRYVDLAISAVNPAEGSIAGGQLVTISGHGFTADTLVTFNGNVAAVEQILTPNEIVVRIPAGRTGPADVVVSRYGVSSFLPAGFTYYNNANTVEWTSGGKINGTINGFVYNSRTGLPLKDAYVLIGSDLEHGLGAFTDSKGMVTISRAGLKGPLDIVTASKPGYSNQSYVMVDARDLLFWLLPSPETWEAYLKEQEDQNSDNNEDDNGNNNNNNGNNQQQLFYPVVRGHVSRKKSIETERGSVVWVFYTNTYGDSTPYVQQGGQLQYDGDYQINGRLGSQVIVALSGDYDEKSNFIPKAIGISNYQLFDYNQSYQVDIVIDTPLDNHLTVNFDQAPLSAELPTTSVLLSIDLGATGYLPWPRLVGDSATMIVDLPSKLPNDLGEMKVSLRAGIYAPNLSTPLTEVRVGQVDHTKPVTISNILPILKMTKPVSREYFNNDYEFIFTPNVESEYLPTFNQIYYIDGVSGSTSWMVFTRGGANTYKLPRYDGISFGSPFGESSQTVVVQSYYVPELSFDELDDYRVNDWYSHSYYYDYFSAIPPEVETDN